MKLKRIAATFALAGLAFASQPVFATTITVSWTGHSAVFGGTAVGYESGTIYPGPNGASSANVLIGGDGFQTSDHSQNFSATGLFNTWCVDINHWLAGGNQTYTIGNASDLATDFGATGAARATALGLLANERYAGITNATQNAAFQLAAWSIMFGTANGSGLYTIPSAGFNVTGDAGATSLANTWLSTVGTASNTGNYAMTYLYDHLLGHSAANDPTQDMVVFTNVPEPASLALLGLGLAGLGFARRRKQKTA